MDMSLGDVSIAVIDSEHKTAPVSLQGMEFGLSVGTPHVRDGRLLLHNAIPVDKETYGKWTVRGIPQDGDLILTREAPVGEVCIIPRGSPICLRQRTVLIKPDPDRIVGRYLLYLLMAPDAQERMHSQGGGSTVAHLNIKDVRALRLGQLPTLHEQWAIAEVLGALDDKIAVNERIASTALNLADSYFQLATQSGCGERVTFAMLAKDGSLEFGDGYRTKRAEHGEPGLPILRVAEVVDGEIRPTLGDHVREEYRAAIGAKSSRPGDVVLTTKGTVGRVAIISASHPEFVYSPQVCYFRAADGALVSNHYLFHWLRGVEFWSQAAGMKGQTDMADYLSLGDIRSMRITLPSVQDLVQFSQKCAGLHDQADAARSENRTLTDLRDTLLPLLISGKLRVKDAARAVEEAGV